MYLFGCAYRPSLLGVVLMVLVYFSGGNGEENYNELTMANIAKTSDRSVGQLITILLIKTIYIISLYPIVLHCGFYEHYQLILLE